MILKERFLMKLNKLQINGFSILQNGFCIDFDKASNLSILIGKNGSGKSQKNAEKQQVSIKQPRRDMGDFL